MFLISDNNLNRVLSIDFTYQAQKRTNKFLFQLPKNSVKSLSRQLLRRNNGRDFEIPLKLVYEILKAGRDYMASRMFFGRNKF